MPEISHAERLRRHIKLLDDRVWRTRLLPNLLEVFAKGTPEVDSDTVGYALAFLAGALEEDLGGLYKDVQELSKLLQSD